MGMATAAPNRAICGRSDLCRQRAEQEGGQMAAVGLLGMLLRCTLARLLAGANRLVVRLALRPLAMRLVVAAAVLRLVVATAVLRPAMAAAMAPAA